jgi:hypothetical protein
MIMALSPVITPIAMLLQLVICVLGLYIGFSKKKVYGYLFAVTFLLFALFDLFGTLGFSEDTLAIVNMIAVLAALIGMYLVVQEK